MAFRRFQVTINGTRPLICSNPSTVDTLGVHAKAINYYTSLKKNRNEMAMRRLHWLFSGYWGTEGTFTYGADLDGDSSFEGFADPILPASNFARCLRDGATAWKLGKDTSRSIIVESDAPLQYDGPKDAALMFHDPRYVSVARTGRGVMAVRLRLPQWTATYLMLINDEILDPVQLSKIIDRAGIAEGIGTWRPGAPKGVGSYGRFAVSEMTELEMA